MRTVGMPVPQSTSAQGARRRGQSQTAQVHREQDLSSAGACVDGASCSALLSETVSAGLGSAGEPLDADLREFMESSFDKDFSGVRVHTDAAAAGSSQAIAANAYTFGQDIVFAPGKYAPDTTEGQRLIAHELTHVVQPTQTAGDAGHLEVSDPGDHAEVEAQQVADRVVSQTGASEHATGQALPSPTAAPKPGTVSRDGDDSDKDGGGFLDTLKSFADPALELAGDVIPGAGLITTPLAATLSGAEAMGGESTADKVRGGLGFGTGILNTAAGLGGFEVAGAEGAGAMALGDLSGAALGTLGMAGPVGAVVGAGLAGVGAGIGLDKLSNYVGQKITGDDKGDYSISNGLANVMTSTDQEVSKLWADPSKPAYTQTLGWKLANLLD